MQRVAMDLHAQFERQPDTELHSLLLHSSWRWIVPRAIPFITSLLARVPALVDELRIDTVLFSSMTTALPAMRIADRVRQSGATISAICQGLDVIEPNGFYQAGVRRTLAALDAVLPVSRATGETCTARGMDPERIFVVPNGIDLERFDEVWRLRQEPTRPELDRLPLDAFLCISVGRQVRRKGFAWFIEHVMPRLPPNVHYWLAGTGPEAQSIERAVQRAGLGQCVRVLGLVDDAQLRQLYARADLFVMPNVFVPGDMERFGVVMLEAGACDVPTLAAGMEGIRDVITPGESGFFATSEDVNAFAEPIQRLSEEPERLRDVGQRSAALARERLAWPSVARRYANVLAKIEPRR